MNASQGIAARLSRAGHQAARRAPLTVRTLELVLALALYAGGLIAVDHLTGTAHFPVAVYAMFLMPVVLSVGLRWFRAIERRLGLGGHDLPHIG